MSDASNKPDAQKKKAAALARLPRGFVVNA